jgi:murein DD-endopeptidase MepM/ murein hydrolase activator NlpD
MRGVRVGLALVVISAAAAAAFSGRWPWRRFDVRAPERIVPPTAPSLATARRLLETVDTLRRGETLGTLFARHGVTDLDLARLGPSLQLDPRRVRAGLVFSLYRPAPDSLPVRIQVRRTPEQLVTFQRDTSGWTAAAEPVVWRPELVRVEGGIDNSLYEALDAQVPDSVLAEPERVRLAWDIADVFAWEVDFTRDVQPGDHFAVVFERLISPDGEVRFGRIMAGELSVAGKPLTAFRYEHDGRASFYAEDGGSLRRAFLRAPVQFRRISSTFSSARFHPVLGRFRRHEGTDYAAAPGTPVMAAGDGSVIRAGRAGGYGNLIELRHRSGITTRYGHLLRFAKGIHAGSRVEQGQVIGFVGATGLATGPHLHYEFRVNGVARDSRKVELGSGQPVPGAERAEFDDQRDRLTALLRRPGLPPSAIAVSAPEPHLRGAAN